MKNIRSYLSLITLGNILLLQQTNTRGNSVNDEQRGTNASFTVQGGYVEAADMGFCQIKEC